MGKGSKGGKRTPMTKNAARRIQSRSDRTGKNQGFKSRAQRAADKSGKK